MLFKSLEFKNEVGQKVKVMEIPVLKKDSPFYFMTQVRLQTFTTMIYREGNPQKSYSFRDYLKKVLKWSEYEQLFTSGELKNNA